MTIKYLKDEELLLFIALSVTLEENVSGVQRRGEGLESENYEKKVLEESMRKGHVGGTALQQLLTEQDGSCN